MENINEVFILINGYSLFFFTQWICDPESRYEFGFYFMYTEISIVALNFSIILIELYFAIKSYFRKRKWLKEWNKYFKGIFDMQIKENEEKEQKILYDKRRNDDVQVKKRTVEKEEKEVQEVQEVQEVKEVQEQKSSIQTSKLKMEKQNEKKQEKQNDNQNKK